MYRKNHGVAADYFALGVIAFECMIGRVFCDFILYFQSGLILEKIEKK